MLAVFGQLWECHLLAASGEVFVDRDDGMLSPAGRDEREVAHVQAARRHPELRHLMPERTPLAGECPLRMGAGDLITADGRHLFCGPPCNTRGWVGEARV